LHKAKKLVNKAAGYVAVPVYGVYYVSYETVKHSHHAIPPVLLPALYSAEAFGLAGDALLDEVKQRTGSSERIFDESPPGVHNQHLIPGRGRHYYLPGLWTGRHSGRHVDFAF
jgi:hypothetical protein